MYRSLAVLCALLISRTAAADRPLGYVRATNELHYDVGVVMMQDLSFGGASTSGMGFRITENNGPLARVGFAVLGLPFMLIAAAGDRDKNVKVDYSHAMGSARVYDPDDPNWQRGGRRVDAEIRTTTVETSPFSPQEQSANDAFQARANAGFAGAFMFPIGTAHACAVVAGGTEVRCWGNRTGWGATGIAANPELVTSGTNLVVTARDYNTVITSGATIMQSTTVTLPSNGTFDGGSIALGTTDAAGLCMTAGTQIVCRGVDSGQLGTGAGCDTSVVEHGFL